MTRGAAVLALAAAVLAAGARLAAAGAAMSVVRANSAAASAASGDSTAAVLAPMHHLLAGVTEVRIRHGLVRRYAMSFPTSLPCRRMEKTTLANGQVDARWLASFLATIDSAVTLAPVHAHCDPAYATVDTDYISVWAMSGKHPLGWVVFANGRVVESDSSWKECWADLGARTEPIRAALRVAMPDDDLIDRVLRSPAVAAPAPCGMKVDRLPVAGARIPPVYPEEARRSDVSGTVWIQALVDRSGQVLETNVTESIPVLDQAAVSAVEQWRFQPAMAEGVPVSVWVAIPVKFTLH
jgi:TonB family protein